jgi:hypothetical protein
MEFNKSVGLIARRGAWSSLLLLVIYLVWVSYQSTVSIPYSFLYKISLNNPSSIPVSNNNWAIRKPLVPGSEKLNWQKAPDIELPPFSKEQIVLNIAGQQSYPDLADDLLKTFTLRGVSQDQFNDSKHSPPQLPLDELLNWIHVKLDYTGFQSKSLSLNEIFNVMKGDCTEFTLFTYYSLLSLGQKLVIPVEGYYLPAQASRVVTGANFHSWLLVKIDGSWLIVDPLYKNIEKPSSNYIVTNIMREGVSLPLLKNSNLVARLN